MSSVKVTADSGGGTVSLKAPSSTTSDADVELTLPVDDGSADQYLKTDGSGALSWATVSSVGGATGVDFDDGVRARFGASQDVQIYHDSGSNYVKLGVIGSTLKIEGTAETLATFTDDGGVSLYHNNTSVVETDANGLSFADGRGITLGTDDDARIYQSGTDTVFEKLVAGAIQFRDSIAVATTAVPWRFDKTNNSATTNERHNMFSFGLPGVNRGLAQCGSSNSVAPQWAASSDYRIKENFRAYTGGWDAIKAIPVQLYDEKSPSYWTQGSDKKDLKGWKAHEVQAVIPEAVTGAKDAVVTQALIDAGQYQQSELNHIIPQQLGTTAMIPTIIGALQQAMAKIETLEAKVAALEAA